MLYRRLLRPWLFRMDPEDAHLWVMRRMARWRVGAGLAASYYTVADPRLEVRVLGLVLRNPVGLAAGLDKHGEAVGAWARLGFGSCEIGTVTPRPQEGNPRPRVFRLPARAALVNRMGFNSVGAEAVRAHLEAAGAPAIPVGVNVGRNRTTSNEEAIADYVAAIESLGAFADYLVVNVSSPNTAGLRELQRPAEVEALVRAAVGAAARTGGRDGRGAPPVLVKLAPDFDLASSALAETVAAALAGGAAGIVATNTTISREGVEDDPGAAETGGLSGAPLRERATAVLRAIYRIAGRRVPLVGVGGIHSAEDAYERIRAGASVVQLYTGFIYEGPGLVRRVNRGLLRLLERDGLGSVGEAVGKDAG